MNATALPEGCRLHPPGRCYLPPKLMAFRVGQVVMHRVQIPGLPNRRCEVVREWIRTRNNEHMAYCRTWCVHRWLYHAFRVSELMVLS